MTRKRKRNNQGGWGVASLKPLELSTCISRALQGLSQLFPPKDVIPCLRHTSNLGSLSQPRVLQSIEP